MAAALRCATGAIDARPFALPGLRRRRLGATVAATLTVAAATLTVATTAAAASAASAAAAAADGSGCHVS